MQDADKEEGESSDEKVYVKPDLPQRSLLEI